MNQEEYQNNIIAIVNHYGYESQSRQLIEEMAELTVAINKMWRKSFACGFISLEDIHREEAKYVNSTKFIEEKEVQNVIEEIADTEIMLSQIKYLLGCNDEVEQEKERKILRQLERMKEEVEGE